MSAKRPKLLSKIAKVKEKEEKKKKEKERGLATPTPLASLNKVEWRARRKSRIQLKREECYVPGSLNAELQHLKGYLRRGTSRIDVNGT